MAVRIRRVFTEMLGTFILSQGICESGNNPSVIWAVLWGAIIATGLVSGAQFNPAITTATLLVKTIDRNLSASELVEHLIYILAHFCGAILGALMSWAITRDSYQMMVSDSVSQGQAFVAETFYSSLLILVCFVGREMKENNWFATLAVAVSVYTADITIGRLTGACLNPATGLGINAVDAWHHGLVRAKYMWIYVFAPLLGSFISAALFYLVFRPEVHRKFKKPYKAGTLWRSAISVQSFEFDEDEDKA